MNEKEDFAESLKKSKGQKLVDFCVKLGGKVEERSPIFKYSEFACNVDPKKVLENWEKFKSLMSEVKTDPDLSRVYFGRLDSYFFYKPEEAEIGFWISVHTKKLSEEDVEKLYDEVKDKFYEFMSEAKIYPEFHFIPFINAEPVDNEIYVDIGAEVAEPEMDELKEIAERMLKFKKILKKLVS